MSSRFASPRLILRSRDFRAASWPGLNSFCCSGFLAIASRASQPQQHVGAIAHWRRPSQTLAIAEARVALFFGDLFSVCSSLFNRAPKFHSNTQNLYSKVGCEQPLDLPLRSVLYEE